MGYPIGKERKGPHMKNHRTFNLEFKRQVVEELLSGESRLNQLCRRYNDLTQLWGKRNFIHVMVLVSDGRGNIPLIKDVKQETISLARAIRRRRVYLLVTDTDDGFLKLGYNKQVAEAAGGKYYRLNELGYRKVIDIVRAPVIPAIALTTSKIYVSTSSWTGQKLYLS